MGNIQADALRYELAARLREAYGSLEAAAEALGVPYKTLYRNLTVRGKDRTATIGLEFVMDIVEHLQREKGGGDFSEVYAASLQRIVGDEVL